MDFSSYTKEPEMTAHEARAELEAHYAAEAARTDTVYEREAINLELAIAIAVIDFGNKCQGKFDYRIALQCVGAAMAGAAMQIIVAGDEAENVPALAAQIGVQVDTKEKGMATSLASFILMQAFGGNLQMRCAGRDEGRAIRLKK